MPQALSYLLLGQVLQEVAVQEEQGELPIEAEDKSPSLELKPKEEKSLFNSVPLHFGQDALSLFDLINASKRSPQEAH